MKFDCRYLNHIILFDRQSCCLGVEHNYVFMRISLQELLQRCYTVVTHKVGWCHTVQGEVADHFACRRIRPRCLYASHKSRPCKEIVVAHRHAKVRQQQFHGWLGKQVMSRHLEMVNTEVGQSRADIVCLRVITHHNGNSFLWISCMDALHKFSHVLLLVDIIL